MNTPMTLEEYKQKALDYHKKMYPNLIEERESYRKMPDKIWLAYMEDFSPEVMVQAGGLI